MVLRKEIVRLSPFLACVDECVSERESKAFWILKQSYI